MLRYFLLIILLFSTLIDIHAQDLVINELDADTPGVDNQEFIELKSITPNFSTDGFVLVFFNGSVSGGDSSYLALDLSGYATDSNGLLVIGSIGVSPFPQVIISGNIIQNGADAVAIYEDTLDAFPGGTLATITNLVDVLIYDTSDSDDDGLIDIFNDAAGFEMIQQINEGPRDNTNSIQRNNDGTYFTGMPTPRAYNDGSGILFNAITIATDNTEYDEGESFTINFTADRNVTSDLNFTIDIDNGTFNSTDYTGVTSLTIPNGQNTVSTTITLIDDAINEGDEVLRIQFLDLVEPIIASNNLVEIRVVDNDFTVAPWGTPINPTFDQVSSTQPNGYYNSLDGLADLDLRQAIQDIIADPNTVRAQTYTDIIDILKLADQNPENSNEVWLVYTEEGRPKLDFQSSSSSSTGKWNREHTFNRSRAGYEGIDADDIADGIDVYFTTNADSLRHGYSDAHGLRAVDGPENSSRGSKHYGDYVGPSGTLGSFRGDVARGVLFLELRYNGLEVINGFTTSTGQMGDLATLLDWHRNDPPDDFEMNRNNIVFEWQKNRNPLIDQPLLVEFIWGNRVGDVWQQTLSTNENNTLNIDVYPNPTDDRIFIKGLNEPAEIKVFSVEGKELLSETISNNTMDLKLSSGLYLIEIVTDKGSATKRIIVK